MAFRGLPTHHLKQPKKIGETLNHLGTNTWQSLILSMVTVGASMVDPAFHGIFLILVILWVVPPPRMPVTTRIITSLVGDPYKPSFATVTGRVDNPCDSQRSHSFLGEKNKRITTTTSGEPIRRAKKQTTEPNRSHGSEKLYEGFLRKAYTP